ncbi:MAG TPA: hypothetical protein VLH14_01490, partial [Patescibacteria group bacterium]|nr:hypothetical protein [Patescibacteria group bacterium]
TAPDGYDATADDDVHACSDAQPTVGVTQTGSSLTVTVHQGKFAIQNVALSQNGNTVASHSGGGTWTLSAGELAGLSDGTVTATVTDEGYYTATNTATYSSSH